jgi:raffinose/stachyose/melibiose transport system substrate-binding protein
MEEFEMKRYAGFVMIALLIAAMFTGCERKQEASGGAAAPSGGTITLKWAFWGAEPTELIAKFNQEHPNVKLEYEMLSSDQYVNIINTRLMSNEGPDIFSPRFIDNYEKLIAEGRIMDLTNEPFIQNYSDGTLEQIRASDNKIYAFTASALFLFCFYNKDIFAAQNIEVPTNWQEYLTVCEKLKKAGIVPQVQGLKDLWQCKYVGADPVLTMTMYDGMWPEKLMKGEVKFTDPNVVESYKRIQTFIDRGYLMEGAVGLTFIQAWELFCGGKAAMMAGGTWYSAQAFPSAVPSFELGVMPIPFNMEGEPQVVPYGAISEMQVVNKDSKHLEEAMAFAEWFSQTENLQVYADTTKNLSAGRNVKNQFAPEVALYDELLNNNKVIQFKKEPATITTDYGKVIQNMILGTMDPQAVALELQKKVEETVLKK